MVVRDGENIGIGIDIGRKSKISSKYRIERKSWYRPSLVNVDDSLNFSNHISEVCKKASRKVGVLTRL